MGSAPSITGAIRARPGTISTARAARSKIGSICSMRCTSAASVWRSFPRHGRERLFRCVDRLRANGGRVFFDNNFRARLWPEGLADARSWYDRAFAACDLAMITLDDNLALYEWPDEEAAIRHACSLPPGEVVIKRGADATLVRIPGKDLISVPAFPVAKIVDTTGAGDLVRRRLSRGALAGAESRKFLRVPATRLLPSSSSIPVRIIPRDVAMPVFFLRLRR